jgi:hypothetical protein
MAKTYRAILIDPEMHSIRELEIAGTVPELHELIGAETLGTFRLAAFDEDGHVDIGWIDDVGLTRGEPVYAFLFPRAKDPIAGRCLIIGADRFGETAPCRIPVELLRQDVSWLDRIKPEVVWDEPKEGHRRSIVTYSRVKS